MTTSEPRQKPLADILRELYLKSGNCCAFPGCRRVIMDQNGIFLGQACHIEAASDGGERYRADQDPEERRGFGNLMLMCYDHHQITNDVNKYTVAILKKMKADHEAKFIDIARAIENSITDTAGHVQGYRPTKLAEMCRVLKWDLEPEQIAVTLPELQTMIDRMRNLPIRTRQLLAIVVGRLLRHELPNNRYRYDDRVSQREISEAANLPMSQVEEHVGIMERYKIGSLEEGYEFMNVRLYECPSGWSIWGDFKEFCDLTGIPLAWLLVELRFDLLD